MAMRGGPSLLPVGSAAWIAEERATAMEMTRAEIEEHSFSVRNDMDWLNEHMAEIFSENQMNVAEFFKTPGKLRGKTPRTAKKTTSGEARVPLSDVFSSTPKGAPNPFALSHTNASRAQSPRIQIAEDRRGQVSSRPASPAKIPVAASSPRPPSPTKVPVPMTDSGYHGSQDDFDYRDKTVEMLSQSSPHRGVDTADFAVYSAPSAQVKATPTTASSSFQSAKEEQTRAATVELTRNILASSPVLERQPRSPVLTRGPATIMSPPPHHSSPRRMGSPPKSPLRSSPQRSSPQKSSPLKTVTEEHERGFPQPTKELKHAADEQDDDDMKSPSEASSPIRPIVRKSSLNFASLPAREPMTSKQSLGPRASILGNRGTSFYNPTKKSLGNVVPQDLDDDDHDEMDVDEPTLQREDTTTNVTAHAKTYTQRLQDQISMLGKSQSIGPRPSKSIAHLLPAQNPPTSYSQPLQTPAEPEFRKPLSPKPTQSVAAPGAFPEDEDDDWIAPPPKIAPVDSPARPELPKSHTADVMESVVGKDSISEFTFPSRPNSPGKAPAPPPRSSPSKHAKSASVPTFPMQDPFALEGDEYGLKKTVSVSNPTLATVAEDGSSTPPKSSRAFRDSPLKQVKNKLSSILKSSKGLLASSAAISAEGKSSLLSPSTTRLGFHANASVDTFRTAENVLYPDLSQHVGSTSRPVSPIRTNSTRRTRASTEREKREQKEKDKEAKEREKEREREAKEAKRLAEQMKKLDKLREQEQEKARVFSKEQEKIAAMEKSAAAQKAQERAAQAPQQAVQTPAPPKTVQRSPPKATRTSPRKTKGQDDGKTGGMSSDELDVDMVDAPVMMPPPSVPRPAAASVPRVPGTASKRPVKPTKEMAKPKQAPKLIRVNTVSQNPQFHPSNSMLAASLEDTLGPQQPAPPRQLNSKSSQSSLNNKPSLQSLNGSSKRPKALEMAARRKAEEEREAQRKRDMKLENDRKRAAAEEERRQEQQRKIEAERQEEERRKLAVKKAAIEKAKQTKAPPPPARLLPNGPPDYSSSFSEKGPARPPSRLGSTMHQERPVNATLSKSTSKRPLPDTGDDRTQTMRNPQGYQSQEPKRMRMSEEFDDDIETADTQRNFKGSAIRPPSIYKTDVSKQSVYSNGYAHAPPSAGPKSSGPKDLFRTTVTKQHTNGHMKPTNPMDMAQVSKGDIPGLSHKTPARPLGAKQPPKSAARSSPRYQNGDAIDLPDIDTDDDDEDEDHDMPMAPWANSPALRSALMQQEDIDPMQIFGPPAPLNMEEVFNKDKSRWHKFRARTSSANWSGPDRLTEEEQRRDLKARDKIRKQGGWSYDLSKEL